MPSHSVSRGYELSFEDMEKIKMRAQKTFVKYFNWFLADAISAEDLEQELLLCACETVSKYGSKKSPEEVIKLIHNRITWRIFELTRNAKSTAVRFNAKELDSLEEDKDEMMNNIHDKTMHSEFLKLAYPHCSPAEYKLLYNKFVEGKTFEELAKKGGLTRQRIEQRYRIIMDRLRKRYGVEI